MAICQYAAKKWVPAGYIASPAKLRKLTRSGELKTWEAIQQQMSRNGKPRDAELSGLDALREETGREETGREETDP